MTNRIRKYIGIGAVAVLGALEIAVIYGVVGLLIQFAFGVDLPLIRWIVKS